MSIRYKLLILMLVLSAISLGSFLGLAVNLFKNDKIVYIFESISAQSRSVANQVQSELKTHRALGAFFITGFDRTKLAFDMTAAGAFNKNEGLLQVAVVQWSGQSFKKVATLTKRNFDAKDESQMENITQNIVADAQNGEFSFQVFEGDFNYFIYSERLKNESQDAPNLFLLLIEREEGISTALKKSPLFETYVARGDGTVIMSSKSEAKVASLASWEFFKTSLKDNVSEGASESKNMVGEDSLISYARVGIGDLVAVAIISKKVALRAIDVLLIKSALFFLVLLSLSAILAVYSSRQITRRLRILDAATGELAKGNFEINVDIQSKDEVGRLSQNFRTMAEKISKLMRENVEKARMEKELETAKIVQDTLFPEKNSILGPVRISGYYEPASECGGDWWYYFQIGKRVFVCIGDATGHGAPAALITSAARSAVSLIETSPAITPGTFLQLLNRAIFEASRGHIQMTFFVACIDSENQKLTYANASHNAPFLIKKTDQAIRKKDLIPLLLDKDGFRLGQELVSRYEEGSVEIHPGDRLFFYTDGLTDIRDPKGEILDERGMIKILTGAATRCHDIREMVETMATEANQYRSQTMLQDDVTFFACEFVS